MSRPTILVLAAVVLGGLGAAAALSARAQPPQPNAPSPFTGKAVLVLTRDASTSTTLEKAEIRVIAGRHFVVGREAKGLQYTRERFSGALLWVPLDEVTQFVELEDLPKTK